MIDKELCIIFLIDLCLETSSGIGLVAFVHKHFVLVIHINKVGYLFAILLFKTCILIAV